MSDDGVAYVESNLQWLQNMHYRCIPHTIPYLSLRGYKCRLPCIGCWLDGFIFPKNFLANSSISMSLEFSAILLDSFPIEALESYNPKRDGIRDDGLLDSVSIMLSPSLIAILLHNSKEVGSIVNNRSCSFLFLSPSKKLGRSCSSLSLLWVSHRVFKCLILAI